MGATIKRRGADVGSGFQAAINSSNGAYAQGERAYITRKSIPGKFLLRRGEARRGLSVPLAEAIAPERKRLTGAELAAIAREAGAVNDRDFVPESKAEPD